MVAVRGEVSGSPDVLSELITVPAGRFVMCSTDFYADEGLEREV
jgi:sulfatase modifying factor 1